MKKPDDGGHAFPTLFIEPEHGSGYAGMSLRDYFAGQVMIAFVSKDETMRAAIDGKGSSFAIELAAQVSYACADAMLAARGK